MERNHRKKLRLIGDIKVRAGLDDHEVREIVT
jgi:hypothetical protein